VTASQESPRVDSFIPVVLQFSVAVLTAAVILVLSWIVSRRVARRAKTDLSPYDVRAPSFQERAGASRSKFYLVAMLFILFDIEAAFLFPWAAVFRRLGPAGFWQMAVFIFVCSWATSTFSGAAPLDWD